MPFFKTLRKYKTTENIKELEQLHIQGKYNKNNYF